MKLESLLIKNYRRIQEAYIKFGDATFLIGENNVGKSSVLKAIELFFSEQNKAHDEDFLKTDKGFNSEQIILEAKFTDLPAESLEWKGFRGRVHREKIGEEDVLCIYYRKTYYKGGTGIREMKSHKVKMKEEYSRSKSIYDLIAAGANAEILSAAFPDTDFSKNLIKSQKEKLEDIDDLFFVDETESTWETNPGGIEGNISIKLPKFLLIPAESRKEDINGAGSVLQKTMNELFEEVRNFSDNFKKAHEYLSALSKELDPQDEDKEFGKMLKDINGIVSGVFHQSQLHVTANLSDPSKVIKPTFDIEMSSNVRTKLERQGMGSVRSAAFALLRYREKFLRRKALEGVDARDLIIGFEEPEMYLHPNAATLMRDKIYELAVSSYSNIICTTHSPYMIDLSKKIDNTDYPKQILNLFKLQYDQQLDTDCCGVIPFNTTEAYRQLTEHDKTFLKFLLKIDDNIARVFFCKNIIIIEGDTEEVLFKETVSRLPQKKKELFLSSYQVVKARGKATIISLVKYLKILGVNPFVIHDEDTEEGAIKFNNPILDALEGEENKRLMVKHTIEDYFGYREPATEKPFKMYTFIRDNWGPGWLDMTNQWRIAFESVIAPELFG